MPPTGQERVLFIRARREESLCLVWQLEIKLESKFLCEKTQSDVTTTEAERLRILESLKNVCEQGTGRTSGGCQILPSRSETEGEGRRDHCRHQNALISVPNFAQGLSFSLLSLKPFNADLKMRRRGESQWPFHGDLQPGAPTW